MSHQIRRGREAIEGTVFTQPEFAFDGSTYDPNEDYDRLKTSLDRVRWLMTHPTHKWWTLRSLSERTGSSEAGVSARIRDLRKPKNGGLMVENERMKGGLWRYRVTTNWRRDHAGHYNRSADT